MVISRHIRMAAGLLGALLFIGLVSTSKVHAVDAESITLSPVTKPYTFDAGVALRDSITIINDGNIEYDFIVYTAPYSVKNDKYEPDYTTVKENADAYAWIQFDKTAWHIKPGEQIEVPYTVRVPRDAAPGGHYGVIFAEAQGKEQGGGFTLPRKKRVGSIIYATVNGDIKLSGQVLSTTIPWFQTSAPLAVQTIIENSGNSDFKFKELFTVKDIFGNTKYRHLSEHIILPKTDRAVTLKWDDSAWFGLFKVSLETTVLDKTSRTESLVLMMPKWMIVVVAFMVIGGVYGKFRHKKRL